MAQTIQSYRRKNRFWRDWRNPFSWFLWFLRDSKPAVLFKYDTASGRQTGAETFTRASTATYVTEAGTIATAASGIKRDRHYINGQGPYLLLEGARTNNVTRSSELDNAAWVLSSGGGGSNPVVTANQIASPDGTVNADKVVFAAPVSGDQSFITSASFTASVATWNGSFYAKAFAAGDVGKVLLFRHVGGSGYTTATLTADWVRYNVNETGSVASLSLSIGLRPALGGSTGTVSCYIWGAQCELGAFPSSYIPTTTAAVTRSADLDYFASAMVPAVTTFYVKFVEGAYAAGRIFQLGKNDNTAPYVGTQRAGTVANTTYLVAHHNGTSQVTSTTGTVGNVLGAVIELRLVLNADGSVFLGETYNGAAETLSTASAANALAANWSTTPVFMLNDAGANASSGYASFISVKAAQGVQSLQTMRSL